ncbi:MAG: hypothetical protein M0Z36_05100 [Thermaerobacter sp.]|nr:hypothetical protein [Thermaerobacter sp.]
MRVGTLLALAGLAWLSDWPWLIVVVGLCWVFRVGHWSSPWVWVLGLSGAFLIEALLAWQLPKSRQSLPPSDLIMEGAALSGLSLLWGLVPGLIFWQAALGRDAMARTEHLLRRAGKKALLRSVRVILGVLAVLFYSSGL